MISIRGQKKSDKQQLIQLLEDLQDYEISIDNLGLLKRTKLFGKKSYKSLLKNITRNSGKIFVATDHEKIIGLIAGFIEPRSSLDNTRYSLLTIGYVAEFIVLPTHRGKHIGTRLIQQMEQYFKKQGCTYASIDVMAANSLAYTVYQRLGYADRYVSLYKKIA